jgi:predicted phosphate transport protein (TIGR00153 family)
MSFVRSLRALIHSNDERFVGLLIEHVDLAIDGLESLQQACLQASPDRQMLKSIKEIERAGDGVRRVLVDELLRTYSTPFDREDLYAVSRTIDDVLDAAYEMAAELLTFRIDVHEDIAAMIEVLVDGTRHVRSAIGEMVRHPSIAAEHAVRAKRSENRISALYHTALTRLFDNPDDLGTTFKAREIYRHIKSVADQIDRAADTLLIITVKRA